MKPLTCEMCGSTNLIKQDGVFVCQSCGTKYSIEDAKKMMVEGTVNVQGTVKIDNTGDVEKYMVLARNAVVAGNHKEVYEYSTKVLESNPQNAEAWLLKMKAIAGVSTVGDIRVQEIISAGRNAILFGEGTQEDEVCRFFLEQANCLLGIGANIAEDHESIQRLYMSSFQVYGKNYAVSNCTSIDSSTINNIMRLGDGAIALFDAASEINAFQTDPIQDLATSVRSNLIYPFEFQLGSRMGKYWHPQKDLIVQKYIDKHNRMIEVLPKEQQHIQELEEDKRLHPEKYKSSTTSSNGGCYVATAVYGSYDCPQVWTLRRFRDYTLTKTWYGRAFVHIYYAISPILVSWFGRTVWFRNLWKKPLDKMVMKLNNQGVENTPYHDEKW